MKKQMTLLLLLFIPNNVGVDAFRLRCHSLIWSSYVIMKTMWSCWNNIVP